MYGIRPSDYFWRGKEHGEAFERDEQLDHLFYSALEFRICIERYLFETLVVLKLEDLPKKFEKLYRVGDLSRTIDTIEPEFITKLEFMNIFLEALGVGPIMFIPDMTVLNSHYGKLGSYLHSLKDPEKTIQSAEWIKEFTVLLQDTKGYLEKLIGGDIGSFEMNDHGLLFFEKWKTGKHSKNEIIKLIQQDLYLK